MKDRINPCIHYICKGEDCRKGFVKVDLKKCKNCPKYEPRKCSKRAEPVKMRRQKDKKTAKDDYTVRLSDINEAIRDMAAGGSEVRTFGFGGMLA